MLNAPEETQAETVGLSAGKQISVEAATVAVLSDDLMTFYI